MNVGLQDLTTSVLTLPLQWRIEEGQAIPEPSPHVADAHYVAPDAKTQAVLLLRQARGNRTLAEVKRVPKCGHVNAE